MTKKNILVVDDEEDISGLLQFNLSREGYEVRCAGSGEEALEEACSDPPDLILLDLMLPGIDGLEVFRQLKYRDKTRDIQVIMLTAKGEEADIVTGLEMGADDYVTKPFSIKVLLARVKAVLRKKSRTAPVDTDTLYIHEMVIHPGKRAVTVNGKPVQLTFTEFEILHLLAKRPGWVFTRGQIVDTVRGEDYFVTDRSVDVQIAGLRKKLGNSGKYIETIRGVGYRFKE
ncbi:MAG: DNA-binding response regulator [Desulfobacteraceae bacterium 4484_190.1]|nr:MAG: DNA-binding response regulator [Desulfobacteraceae bacterium 4484_190.1]